MGRPGFGMCCCRNVLIVEDDVVAPYFYEELRDKLRDDLDANVVWTDNTTVANSITAAPHYLNKFKLIFLSLYKYTDTDPPPDTRRATSIITHWEDKLPDWLALGGRRLVILGENATVYQDTYVTGFGNNELHNEILATVGATMRLSLDSTQDEAMGALDIGGTPDGSHYLNAGVSVLRYDATCRVLLNSGLRVGVTDGGFAWMGSEPSGDSEIIVAGDSSWLGLASDWDNYPVGTPTKPVDDHQQFLDNLLNIPPQ